MADFPRTAWNPSNYGEYLLCSFPFFWEQMPRFEDLSDAVPQHLLPLWLGRCRRSLFRKTPGTPAKGDQTAGSVVNGKSDVPPSQIHPPDPTHVRAKRIQLYPVVNKVAVDP